MAYFADMKDVAMVEGIPNDLIGLLTRSTFQIVAASVLSSPVMSLLQTKCFPSARPKTSHPPRKRTREAVVSSE